MGNFYEELIKVIENNRDSFPKVSLKILEDRYIDGQSYELDGIYLAFEAAKKQLEQEYNKAYRTDTYEYSIITMASRIIVLLLKHISEFVTQDDEQYLEKLYKLRYIGYAFFSNRQTLCDVNKEHWTYLKEDKIYGLILYKSMLKFFDNFYGDFNNNEKAIEFICLYFPKGHESNEELSELIINSIKSHFRSAGTINDSGYAFGGIQKIREYFAYLPLDTVIGIIEDCSLYEILNNATIRHQVYAAIDGSSATEEEKRMLKFSYLDSLMIANAANVTIVEMYGDEETIRPYYLNTSAKVGENKMGILYHEGWSKDDNPYGYWALSGNNERSFYLQRIGGGAIEAITIELNLEFNTIELYKGYSDDESGNSVLSDIDFNYDDYSLFDLNQEAFLKRLEAFVSDGRHTDQDQEKGYSEGEEEELMHSFTFSYVYLNNYRTLRHQDIDFDHRYDYDPRTGDLIERTTEIDLINGVYGASISSLSCIVGKNGTGKTSTIEFLRQTFFKILKMVNDGIIMVRDGKVEAESFQKLGLLDEKTEFMVVFRLGGKDYYMTNMSCKICEGIDAFEAKGYKRDYQLSKVIHFSSALDMSNPELFWSVASDPDLNKLDPNYERVLVSFRQMDYSEDRTFMIKHRMMDRRDPQNKSDEQNRGVDLEKYTNRELLYQLYYISNMGYKALAAFLGLNDTATVKIISKNSEEVIIKDGVLLFHEEEIMPRYVEYIKEPESIVAYLSAGQMAKLSLFAKLFWMLNGKEFYLKNKRYLGSNAFDENAFLMSGESAVVFMDECELYLHPEWQRTLLADWLSCIDQTGNPYDIQFVMTTNSPFIISDVLSEDVHYLPKESSQRVGTFAQNIHMLLMRNFFMENTIGEYSKLLIKKLIEALSNKEGEVTWIDYMRLPMYEKGANHNEKSWREKSPDVVERLINKIDEPIYRDRLLDMLYKTQDWKEYRKDSMLLDEREIRIMELEAELHRLRSESYDKA